MNITRARARLIAAAAIGLGAALALTLPAGAAVVNASPPTTVLKLAASATLQANGAAVITTLKITCPAGWNGYASVTIAENVAGGFIASGTGAPDTIYCTGSTQTILQSVIPTQRAFAKGVAFGSAHFGVCGPDGCQYYLDEHNVQIKP